ncbi:MAG: NUDIX hydrolase [Desulfobacteraceae bacterium]|jgi:ADP-ribose pyrophosphatase
MGSESAYPKHPRLAVGAIVFKDDKVLLVKRGRPPAKGQWAIPGGNVKLGESLQKAAQREIFEETGITIQVREPVYTFDAIVKDNDGKIQFHYVIVDLAAEFVRGRIRPGDDAANVRWVAAEELGRLNVSAPTLKLLRDQFQFGT